MKLRTLLIATGSLFLASCSSAYSGEVETASQASQPAFAGTVASADPRATAAGEEMLRRGGSATDAAIATMIALTVVEPQSSGIGGGGFIVRGAPGGEVTSYDGRETAPAAASPDWFLDEDGKPLPSREAVLSGLSIGVPGNISVAQRAHGKHGKLPWATLFEPAIKLARDGFILNPRLNASLDGYAYRAGLTEGGKATFYAEGETPKAVGSRILQPALAGTLEMLATMGPDHFYSGPFASGLADTIAAATPRAEKMTMDDVIAYQSKERDPVCGDYRGYKICGMGPPSSGGLAIIAILEQLERFDLAAMGPRSVKAWHLFVESQRLAYADRALYTGDADFVDIPVDGLISPAYLAARSQLIDPDRRTARFEAGKPPSAPQARAVGENYPDSGTTHLVAIGADGTMVSYTSTIEGAFGSGYMFGGFYLNNELTDFSFRPERDGQPVANRVQGGKRPRSSMAPTVVYDPDGKPLLAIGAAGGPTIPIQTARSIIGVIDFGLSLEEALAMPMIMAFGPRVIVEKDTWLADAAPQLNALGHEQVITSAFLFRTNAAMRTQDGWTAAHDPRLIPLLQMPAED
ncbi:gamma-glutamyltransferase [Parerythrobacter jejuensis]|uniref:Glutathione hydrolase proenzyme n=1 Tax=Parerythrobacter jejuensis TaxID=795812 RepID=A0A845AP73_9SPHN|nr:gamma-glutamyltransferase [Parerythrobacter jejuensis]MXP30983.1 gamma-glutamyltransferase [Parerythrobacter jejuensis]MXP33743.1 gamma-glutamyltransferase [Parerythrobacter jejuensis]